MMNRPLEFPAQQPRMATIDARHQEALFASCNLCGDFHYLLWRFAFTVDHLRKIFPQRSLQIHLGEPDIYNGRPLKSLQHLLAAYRARAKLLQQSDRFRCRHAASMAPRSRSVTREMAATLRTHAKFVRVFFDPGEYTR